MSALHAIAAENNGGRSLSLSWRRQEASQGSYMCYTYKRAALYYSLICVFDSPPEQRSGGRRLIVTAVRVVTILASKKHVCL